MSHINSKKCDLETRSSWWLDIFIPSYVNSGRCIGKQQNLHNPHLIQRNRLGHCCSRILCPTALLCDSENCRKVFPLLYHIFFSFCVGLLCISDCVAHRCGLQGIWCGLLLRIWLGSTVKANSMHFCEVKLHSVWMFHCNHWDLWVLAEYLVKLLQLEEVVVILLQVFSVQLMRTAEKLPG